MGIEPTRPAWKAGILPLNYTRIAHIFAYLDIISQSKVFVNTPFSIFLKNFSKSDQTTFFQKRLDKPTEMCYTYKAEMTGCGTAW